MHREESLKPFSRHFPNIFNSLTLDESDETVVCKIPNIASILKEKVKYEEAILYIPFKTFDQYMTRLEQICIHLNPLGSRAMVYLAAAVSDFVVTELVSGNSKFKISSNRMNCSRRTRLRATPNFILPLVLHLKLLRKLSTVSFQKHSLFRSRYLEFEKTVISCIFQLETDESKLLPKAKAALSKYGHQLVIANMLSTRKHKVTLVRKDREEGEEINLPVDNTNEIEIESIIIDRVGALHQEFLNTNK